VRGLLSSSSVFAVRRSSSVFLCITMNPWHLMGGVDSGGQLSPSHIRHWFKSWCHYERRFDSQCRNGLVVMVSFPSLQLGDLLGSCDEFSGTRVFSSLALIAMDSFIRL